MQVSDGGWIIKGVNGEFYPCEPERRNKMTDGNTYAINKHLDERERIDELLAENKRLKSMIADLIYDTGDDPKIMAAPRAEWAERALAAEDKLAAIEKLMLDLAGDKIDLVSELAGVKWKLEKAVEALDEAVYLLAPDDKEMMRKAGVYRIVTTLEELKNQSS